MALTVADLIATLKMDTSGFSGGVQSALRDADGLTGGLKKLATSAAAMSATFVAAGAAVFGMAKHAADAGDEMQKMSRRTGIAVETLSGLKAAAMTADTSLEGLEGSLTILASKIEEARGGNKDLAAGFKRLGVDVTNTNIPMIDQFEQLAKSIGSMTNQQQAIAAAREVFGRGGAQLLVLLQDLKGGYKLTREEAQRLGRYWTTEQGQAAEAFNDDVTRLMSSLAGIPETIGKSMIPTMAKLVQSLTDVAVWFRKAFVEPNLEVMTEKLRETIEGQKRFISGIADTIGPLLTRVYSSLQMIVTGFLSLPAWIQDAGLIGAYFFGAKGFLVLTAISTAMGLIGQAQRAFEAFKKGLPLSEMQSMGPQDVEKYLSDLEKKFIEAREKFRFTKTSAGLAPELKTQVSAFTATAKAIEETAAEAAELDATAARLTSTLSLSGRASADFSADLTPLNVRLADDNTLFQDVRVGTKEYSLALTDLSVSLVDVTEQADGYLASTSDVAAMLNQAEPVLKSLEDRLAEQITLFPKTRVQADSYLTTLGEISVAVHGVSTESNAMTTALGSAGSAFNKVFSGVSDILSLFGVKVGKVFLMLQNLPRAVGGIMDMFKGAHALLQLASMGGAMLAGSPLAAAADGIDQLGKTAMASAGILGGFGKILQWAIQIIGMFGAGIMGVFSVVGQIIQGIASGGGIVNTLTSVFGGLTSAGGALMSVFSGVSNIGGGLLSLFTGGGSDRLLTGIFDLFTTGGRNLLGFGGAELAGQFGKLLGSLGTLVPIAGALTSVAFSIKALIEGNTATGAGGLVGTAIGAYVGSIIPGIGTFLGATIGNFLGSMIGGLFAKTPKASLFATIAPFDRNHIGSVVDTTVPGTQVGAVSVGIGGNVMSNKKEDDLKEQLARMLNDILISVVGATVKMLDVLPPAIAAQLDSALTALESTGLEIVDKKWKGGKAGKKLKKRIESLADEAIQDLFATLYGTEINLKELGGGKRGGAGKGFDLVMQSLGLLSVIAERAKDAVTLAGVSLAQFTQASVDLVKKFAREKESFEETLKRLTEGFGKLFQLMDQLSLEIAAANGDVSVAFNMMIDAYQGAVDQMIANQDALTVAVESGAGPEEVVQAAEAARQAIAATLSVLQQIDSALTSLGSATAQGANLFADLEATIRSTGGAATSVDDLLDGAEALASVVGDTSARISIFSASIRAVSLSVADFISAMPRLQTTLTQLLSDIRNTTSPSEALGQLKDVADAINQGAANAIQSITANTQTAQTMAQGASNARVAALERERDVIQQVDRLQQEALQTQIDGIQGWMRIAESVRGQLGDLFNLLAPTHPQTSLDDVLGQFRSAFSAFQGGPSIEGASQVQDLAKQVLTLAQQTPGYDLPSLRFQDLATEVRTALEAVQAVAENQPNELDLLAQIADLDQRQADQLQAIEAQIAVERDSLQATLQGISASEQAQIAQVHAMQAQALSQIRDEVRLRLVELYEEQQRAREVLQQITGALTWEQFIAQKHAESVDMLTQIRDVLRQYLGNVLSGLGLSIPSAATGMEYVPQDGPVYLHRGERVLTAGENHVYTSGGEQSGRPVTINFAPTVELKITGSESPQRIKRNVDKAVAELLDEPSLTRGRLVKFTQEHR